MEKKLLGTPNRDVIIRLCNKIYIGTITHATENYINIQAVELKTNKTIATKFYRNELTFIKPLKQYGISTESPCDFTLNELNRMSQLLNNCVFIQRYDINYHNALAHIAAESTSRSLYIFDVQVLGRVKKGIKNILESNVPKKIIHDSSRCADHLKHIHNINLIGVFDTMVAHCSLGFDKIRISLDECLRDHFNIPGKFLMDEDVELWHPRPLSSNNRNIAAQNVLFLQKLHCKLTRIALKSILETTTS